MAERLPILCLDFDGVIHSYVESGWQGAAQINDPPVDGALEFLVEALKHFEVHILSSRSHQWGGRRAMKKWLIKHFIALSGLDIWDTPEWWRAKITETAFADPWLDEVKYAAKLIVSKIKFPRFKPPAHVTIDDRAIGFEGEWIDIQDLLDFKPWNKR